MREILFRGKTEKGEWVYGDLLHPDLYGNGYAIEDFTKGKNNCCDVVPETVGQYTGLTDKNGQKIFEGDIVKGLFLHSSPVNSVIEFRDGCFGLLWYRDEVEIFWSFSSICNVEYEVIGNIHDNPELLKGGEG